MTIVLPGVEIGGWVGSSVRLVAGLGPTATRISVYYEGALY
jgi:hypothetical protein